ncbi:lysophospholipid acyltransferase family protein [Gemmobacter sp.]|uniref:lysophospholipid acyltransferase family protein n=1 Tax=Gemmobacter sp. TaxID=1898957 RepID=UPI002AFE6BC4|nr:lysophospholipid acyltransferase family protein [Gemmobacter sp.]
MTALISLAPPPQTARAISYAPSARSPAGRMLIRTVENLTGRMALVRRARGFDGGAAHGPEFWREMMRRYGLHLELLGGSFDDVPTTGPLVMIANHPYGILDGLVMGHILSALRGDFRLMAHEVFRNAPDLRQAVLPVDFSDTAAGRRANIAMRGQAVDWLAQGGALGIFPGGTVSTAARPFEQPMDPVWRSFTARLIARTGAAVVPVWFEGANSRLFQLASHLHMNLRLALLLREFRARVDRPVRLVVGTPIPAARLAAFRGDSKAMMDFLRRSTYELAPWGLDAGRYGHEFEAHHKR